jgi:hypothetical protein
MASYSAALPNWQSADVVGSPYCATTSSTITWAAPAAWPSPARALRSRGVGLILEFVPTMWHPTIAGQPPSRNCSSSPPTSSWRRSSVLRARGRSSPRQRPRPVLPCLARRASAQRVRAITASGGWRDTAHHRRAVRRRALRHGDARHERCVRPDLARFVGPTPNADYWPSVIQAVHEEHPGSSSSPRRTGICNGTCSSEASTAATTNGCMTGC